MAQSFPNKTVQMAHVINLLSIAMLDGKITEEEKNLVFQIASDFGLTETEFQQCIDISKKADGQVIYEVPENENDRIALLKNLALMMMIDGKIDANERQYLAIVADKFGFDGNKAVDILIRNINEEVRKNMGGSPEAASNETPSGGQQMTDEEFAAEMQMRIAKGKEALENHRIQEAFDMLFIPSNLDAHALRLMMKLINQYHRVRLITDEQIKNNQVEIFAEKGYPMAQYVLARYHQQVKPEKDSIEKAKKWYDAAKKAGLGDAAANQGVMVLDGYYGLVDMNLYYSLMQEGLDKGYTTDYCSFALYTTLREMVYGHHDTTPNPQSVVNAVKNIIGSNESDDIDVVDPAFYKILGEAYTKLEDIDNAKHYFEKAIDMGYVECCSDYALLMPPNDDFTHEAWKHWEEMNMIGCQQGDSYSYVLASVLFETPYDDLSENEKRERTEQIKETLLKAYSLGDEFSAYLLGSNYYYGKNGFEQNDDEAWRWFNNAAFWEESLGYAMAAEMIEEGEAPSQYDQVWSDHFYLQALRRGDDNQLGKVVEIYRAGRLTEFAKEIETLYIPKYEALPEEPTDDPESEIDLKLIAIIKTDGSADIIEFDVENWDELPPFVDAKRLDAIRVQPLYDISKKLGYSEHITGWVDNMGLIRDLPSNPVGCKIYPGRIVGDMILTLEDEKYNPMSFTDLDDLKQVLSDLGAKLMNVFLDDGPDDDGRFDAWS